MTDKKLLILGDNHLAYFTHALRSGLFYDWQHDTCEVPGATIIGQRNPNAPVNALNRFKRFLAPQDRNATIVIQLGEVDCGFVMWYRAQHNDEPVLDQLRASLVAYFDFLHDLTRAGFSDIVITGATLPAIRDGVDWGTTGNKRREVTATLAERTALTINFNNLLQAGAEKNGWRYLDITGEVLDPATKTVRQSYLSAAPLDGLLHREKAGILWGKTLYSFLAGNPQETDAASLLFGGSYQAGGR